MKRFLSIVVTIALLLTLAPINVQAAKLSRTKLNLIQGEVYTDLSLENAFIESMKSSNKKICTIDKYGYIHAKKAGSCKVTVKDYNGKKYTCKVKVYSKKSILDKLSIEPIVYKGYDTQYTYYLLTNNSPIRITPELEITGKKLSGDIEVSYQTIYGLPSGGKVLVSPGYECVSATFKFTLNGSQRKKADVSADVKIQSEDSLISITNNTNKSVSAYLSVLFYDESGNIINTYYDDYYFSKKDSYRTNESHFGYFEPYTDEDGDLDERYVYQKPARCEVYCFGSY